MVTVTCPQCGGGVDATELGERTRCRYCHTELHLPTLHFESESGGASPVPSAIPTVVAVGHPRRHPVMLILFLGALALLVLGLAGYVTSRSPASQTGSPAAEPIDQAVIARATCVGDCAAPCAAKTSMLRSYDCFHSCQNKCGLSGAECLLRCDDICTPASGIIDTSCSMSCNLGCSP